MNNRRILHIVGARPNFMKVAPVFKELQARGYEQIFVHTGQHYDVRMSDVFFQDLNLPEPDMNLGVGSGSHATQTAEIMIRLEPLLNEKRPNLTLVYGDVNSTLAAALTANKLGLTVGHVEAGLRSRDRSMPEEINRILTDHLSDLLFAPSQDGVNNLAKEGVPTAWVHLVGNVMIDTLLSQRKFAEQSIILSKLGLEPRTYALCTLHRPSNVDDPEIFCQILKALGEISSHWPVIFPMHPRSQYRMEKLDIKVPEAIRLIDPVGYRDFLQLTMKARLVLSDSGGIQEETTALGIPCVTLRENTERPITISEGTNVLGGVRYESIMSAVTEACKKRPHRIPALWDGQAARRIADVIDSHLIQKPAFRKNSQPRAVAKSSESLLRFRQ